MADTDTRQPSLKFAGEVAISDIKIVSANGLILDVFNQMVDMNIYEDITAPAVSGDITLNDSLDLVNLFPLIGEEKIFIRFKTPTFSDEAEFGMTFYIYKMSNREQTGNKNVTYTMHFTSFEAVRDLNSKISRGFSGKIDELVRQIMIDPKHLQSNKDLFIGKTKNNITYVSNYWTPFQNINYLAARSISDTNSAANFMFFENHKGYVFEALENMVVHTPICLYTYDENNRAAQGGGSVRTPLRDLEQIESYEIHEPFNYMNKIQMGGIRSKAIFHDITTKRYETKSYDYDFRFDQHNHLNPYRLKTKGMPARNTSRIELVNRAYEGFLNQRTDRAKEWYMQRLMQLSEIFSTRLNMEVPGRTDMVVGAVIDVVLYKMAATDPKQKEANLLDNVFSGRYLVTKVRHHIKRTDNRHTMYLEVVKDSFIKDVFDPAVTGYSSSDTGVSTAR